MTDASVVAAPQHDGVDADQPLVSFVIATYNRWPLVRETIESVLAQSCPRFEVVVVDDGSSDGTADHIETTFPSVRVVRQENTERGVAFNRGVTAAKGKYVAILGSDDVVEPSHLAQFEQAWRRAGDAPVFAGPAWLWDPASDRKVLLPPFNPETLRHDALLGTAIAPQAMIVSRAAFLEVGGYPEDRSTAGSEDWVLLIKLTRRFEVQTLPEPTVRLRQHPGRSMANLRKMAESREAATRLILEGDLLGYRPDAREARLIAAGTHRLSAAHYYGAGDMAAARARIRDVCRTLGWLAGIRWTGRLWLQTWLGTTASAALRRLKERLTWR